MQRAVFVSRAAQCLTYALLLAVHTTAALAQSYPSRPITVMVGFAPGGTSDVAARIVAERMSVTLNTPVLVENRAGAGGSVAAAAAAKSAPDGYTIMLADPGAYAINPILFAQNARYDPLVDFTPIALVGQSPLVLVVPAVRPYANIADLTSHIRANPDRALYASSGAGGITQFGAEVFLKRAGNLNAVHVAYRGGAPMMEALLKGETDFGVAVLASAVSMIESGSVRALAIAAPSATALVKDTPQLESLGFSNTTMSSWVIMIGPAGIPAEIVAQLNGAINLAIGDPAVREKLLKAGIETYPPATPAGTGSYLKGEVERYRGYKGELGDRLVK